MVSSSTNSYRNCRLVASARSVDTYSSDLQGFSDFCTPFLSFLSMSAYPDNGHHNTGCFSWGRRPSSQGNGSRRGFFSLPPTGRLLPSNVNHIRQIFISTLVSFSLSSLFRFRFISAFVSLLLSLHPRFRFISISLPLSLHPRFHFISTFIPLLISLHSRFQKMFTCTVTR